MADRQNVDIQSQTVAKSVVRHDRMEISYLNQPQKSEVNWPSFQIIFSIVKFWKREIVKTHATPSAYQIALTRVQFIPCNKATSHQRNHLYPNHRQTDKIPKYQPTSKRSNIIYRRLAGHYWKSMRTALSIASPKISKIWSISPGPNYKSNQSIRSSIQATMLYWVQHWIICHFN